MRTSPTWPATVETLTVPVAGGIQGVRQTLGAMRAMVTRYKTHPSLREVAANCIYLFAPKHECAEACAIYECVRDSIRYTRDINGVETLQTPDMTWRMRIGDCDDVTTLLCTLLESVGYPTRFVVAGYNVPDLLEHVYSQAFCNGEWWSMDPSEYQYFGWEPPDAITMYVEAV